MGKKKIHIAIAAALSTGFSVLGCQVVLGQEAEEAEAATGLEEITVTATRRVQNMQEVPISVVAITGEIGRAHV